MLRLLLLPAALVLGACSSFYSSSREEKLAAYTTHQAAWTFPSDPKMFGLSRSVQVIQLSKIDRSKGHFSYAGGLGMVSLITKDGYAITAAHVIENPPLDAFATLITPKNVPVPTLHVQRQIGDGGRGEDRSSVPKSRLVAYTPESAEPLTASSAKLAIRTLRIVASFPEQDIALVKLPLRTAVCFELRRAPLRNDTVLFASGNWATAYSGISAGTVLSVSHAHPPTTIIRSNTPLAKGDSGGPVFDVEGRLVGIASRVIPSQFLPYPKLRNSSLRMLDPDTVEALIRADRAQNH